MVLSSTLIATSARRRYWMRWRSTGARSRVYLDGVLIIFYTLTGGDVVTCASQTKDGLRSNVSTTARFALPGSCP